MDKQVTFTTKCGNCKKENHGATQSHWLCSDSCKIEFGRRFGNKRPEAGRTEAMIQMHAAGESLQAIGDAYGVTRERVRQILTKAGVSKLDGGQFLRVTVGKMASIAESRAASRTRFLLRWGIERDDVVVLNDGLKPNHRGSKFYRYRQQARNADGRQIGFRLTFPEWVKIWNDSGKWDQRGKGVGCYVMARFADQGDYEVGNVHIILSTQNLTDYHNELKIRGAVGSDGKLHLPEKPAALGESYPLMLGGYCKKGHPFNEQNTLMVSEKIRKCRECSNAHQRSAKYGTKRRERLKMESADESF